MRLLEPSRAVDPSAPAVTFRGMTSSLAAYLGHSALSSLLLCLLVVLIVTAVVYFVGQHLAPQFAGVAAFFVLLIGCVICLFG